MDLHLNELDQHFTLPVTRKVGFLRPLAWIKMGWQDLIKHPAPSLLYGLIISVTGALLLLFTLQDVHLYTTAITGFLLLAPLGAAGIYELTSERDEGRETSFLQSIHDLYKNGGQLAFFRCDFGFYRHFLGTHFGGLVCLNVFRTNHRKTIHFASFKR
ncbi:DUF2189 domain-containing protein [Deefgea sp. CFH1-16]|uniref:DUF2189 domain-containing protein n=1 Tax=Deefgea sp. CFH1-16 TaxID=2675457 RepID=UPI001FFD2C73|nr:DUF2189 domain-containing protein [Deefgea sp. CFH1-16]